MGRYAVVLALAGCVIGAPASGMAQEVRTSVTPGKPVVKGALDKEVIRRVIRQHRNEVRYCYEKQLVKDPKLEGKVVTKFTISKEGTVVSALVSSSTLENEAVESCLTRKMRRWVFPEPRGGGIVVVNYPFVFTTKKGEDAGSEAKLEAKPRSSAVERAMVAASRPKPVAKFVPGKPKVQGALDKDVIRRVVRRHHNEIRYCYDKALKKSPRMGGGKVEMKWVIGAKGEVTSVTVASSTFDERTVGECISKRVSRWSFPAPKGGGVVAVSYPFVFSNAVASTKSKPSLKLKATPKPKATLALDEMAKANAVKVAPGKPEVGGSLEKEIIRRVVRQHRREIRYCYEKELQKDPKLAGEVHVRFVISQVGAVESVVVTHSTLGSEAVESCMTRAVGRWVFPEPKGDGVVVVNYPFAFSR